MLLLERPPAPPQAPAPVAGQPHGLATALIDAIECGLVTCDGRGRLLHLNRAARREMASGQVLRVVDGALRGVAGPEPELADAISDAVARHRRRLLWLGSGTKRLMVVAMPLCIADDAQPAALLVLGRRSLCSQLGLEMLALQHGLTSAERRVLNALMETQPARQIAAAHGVRLSTVRTQIQSIREKLGAHTVEEVLLRVAQVPAVTSAFS